MERGGGERDEEKRREGAAKEGKIVLSLWLLHMLLMFAFNNENNYRVHEASLVFTIC